MCEMKDEAKSKVDRLIASMERLANALTVVSSHVEAKPHAEGDSLTPPQPRSQPAGLQGI
jgi:hypothetical protein